MIEKQMIRLMLNKKFYTQYKGILSPTVFAGDISSLYETIQKSHEKYEEDIKIDELYSLHTAIFNPALTRAAKEKFSELVEDIKDMNRSEWTVRDQSIMDAIDIVLRKEFGSDRKTND